MTHPTSRSFAEVTADAKAHHPGRVALTCASLGWRVLPLRRATKQPVLRGWPERATTDVETIIEWWSTQYAGSLCGVATGRESGIWVLDVDVKNDDGLTSLHALEAQHSTLPRTFTVRTPSGGEHRYFSYPDDREVATRGTTERTPSEWRGIESRGWHGQVVAPLTRNGSHDDGSHREYVIIDDTAPVPAPDWLLEYFTRRQREPWSEPVTDRSYDEGLQDWALGELQREVGDFADYPELTPGDDRYGTRRAGSGANSTLNNVAYYLASIAAHGLLTREEVTDALVDACRRNHLWDDEGEGQCLATIESGWNAGLSFPAELPRNHLTVPEYAAFVERMRGGQEVVETFGLAEVVDIRTRTRPEASGDSDGDGGGTDTSTPTEDDGDDVGRNTDRYNARELIDAFGDVLCWTPEAGWLHWDGRRWKLDSLKNVHRLCELLAETLIGRLPQQTDEERRTTWQRVRRLESAAGVKATLEYAEATLARNITDFDRDPWLLNCPNGTLDLRSGELRDWDPADLLTRMCPTEYRHDAQDTTWLLFLSTALEDAQRVCLQRFMGSCLTGIVRDKAFMVPTGPRDTGKSTATEPVLRVLGDVDEGGYATTWDESVIQRGTRVNRDEKANKARAARLIVVGELTRGSRFEDSFVKRLTGGDTVDARAMYKGSYSYRPGYKLIMHSNYVPRSADPALHSRLKLLPFGHVFTNRSDDVKAYLETDRNAQEAILAWLVQGCLDWQRHGLGDMPWLDDMLKSYAQDSDQVLAFIEECLETTDKQEEFAHAEAVWLCYEAWSLGGGEKRMSRRAFVSALEERGLQRVRLLDGNGVRHTYWRDVRIVVK